jgi:CubicO group peptidase (beta-lactamase class C family)
MPNPNSHHAIHSAASLSFHLHSKQGHESMKHARAFFALIIIGLWLLGCGDKASVNPTPQNETAALDQAIQAEMSKDGLPSLAAGIIKGDKIVWQNFYGYSNVADKKVPTAETIYVLASISKTVTATAVMQLWEKGQLDLDKDINAYLPFKIRNPQYPNDPITARHLLTHRAGLAHPNGEDPNFYQTYPNDTAPALGPWLGEYLVPDGSEYVAAMWKNAPPGTVVENSNIGVALLGYLVEAITGVDFGEYCRQNIFAPLEMGNSGFRLRDVGSSQLAGLYTSATATIGQYSVKFYPAVMMRSSIKEFSHFAMAYLNSGEYNGKRILQAATINEMLRLQVPEAGLGLIWRSFGNGYMGHTGGLVGVSSSLSIDTAGKLGLLIFTNTVNKGTVYPGGKIYELVRQEAEKYR